jgi:superoxide dismutase
MDLETRSSVLEGLMRAPPPILVEGAHVPQRLPFDPGAIPGISAEQDLIHHGRRYVGFVSEWNVIERAMHSAASPETFVHAQARLPLWAQEVSLHELFFWQLSPTPSSPEALDLPTDVSDALPWGDGWVLQIWDLHRGATQWATLDGRELRGLWGGVPIVAIDLFRHGHWVDHMEDRESYLSAILPQISLEKMAERQLWAEAVRDAFPLRSREPMESRASLLFLDEDIALRNALRLQAVRATPEQGRDEEIGDRLGDQVTEDDLARWLAWSPGWAVLAWEIPTGSPLLLSMPSPESPAPWGCVPLMAIARENRPEDLEEARASLRHLPWGDVAERLETLRSVGPFPMNE